MRPITVTVGPLAAASATKIALSQTAPAGQSLAVDGAAASGYSATSISTAATISGAAALTLNGSTVSGGVARLSPAARIVIVSAGNDSGITFTVRGLAADGVTAQSETLTGANTSRTGSANVYSQIFSITTSGSSAGNVSAGVNGVATLDKPRRVLITSGGNDSGITFAITGTDVAGNVLSETVTGSNTSTAYSTGDYLTVTRIAPSAATASTVTIGTNGVASSAWVRLDDWAMSQTAIQCTASGPVNYTVQQTLDDPNDPTNAVVSSAMTWVSSSDTGAVGATGSIQTNYAYNPKYARILLNSGTGSVTATFSQALATTF